MNISPHSHLFITKLAAQLNRSFETIMTALTTNGVPDPAASFRDGEIVELSIMTIVYSLTKIENAKRITPSRVDIDISDLVFLESLNVLNRKSNEVSWTVSSITNPRLRKLYYQTGDTKVLDVSKLPELEELVCHMNELTSLDVSNNPKLKHLNCQSNKITSLDLSMNPRLAHVNFQDNEIDVANVKFPPTNEISGLIMRGCVLRDADLMTQFPYLKKLYVSGKHLTSLNLRNNTLLTQLSVDNLQTDELDISNCTGLVDPHFADCRIRRVICSEMQSYTIKAINKKIRQKPTVEQQDILKTFELHQQALSHNWDEGVAKLKKILKNGSCDLATARAIYWLSRPVFFLRYEKASDVAPIHLELFKFVTSLEKQLMSGSFTRNYIPFDPRNFMGQDWTTQKMEANDGRRHIPDKLKERLIGTPITCFDVKKKISMDWPF